MAKKKRTLPPWGGLFDGKPIEREWPRSHPEYGKQAENEAKAERFRRMVRLKEHYGIKSRPGWRELSEALAGEMNPALTIVDPPPPPSGRTRPRWKGWEGGLLLDEFYAWCGSEGFKAWRGGRPFKQEAALRKFHSRHPRYRDMPFASFNTAFHTAKRHHPEKVRSET